MKKYYLLFIAILLLLLDIRIPAAAYPAYEAFLTQAPQTVELVIGHVVGSRVRVDLLSDALGYLLLMAAAVILSINNKKFRRVAVWSALSFGVNLYKNIMPFLLNGSARFRVGYLIYFIAAVLEAVTVFYAMYTLCGQLETLENHSYNNLTVIVAMLCVATGFVSATVYFFDLIILAVIYYLCSIAAAGVYFFMVYKDRNLLMKWEEEHA